MVTSLNLNGHKKLGDTQEIYIKCQKTIQDKWNENFEPFTIPDKLKYNVNLSKLWRFTTEPW